MVYRIVSMFCLSLLLMACAAPGKTPADQRNAIDAMQRQVLNEIYAERPAVRGIVREAPGYAVFSNVNVNLIFFAAGSGYGVAIDNKSGNRTYMKMAEGGLGLGAGVKDFRALFVFENTSAMNRFMTTGWQVGANADAAAKAGEKGAAVGKEAVADGISVYQLTESGVALQATIKGAKFWIDEDLN